MRVSLVVAMARNRAIGKGGGLPWHLPADLAHFRRVTLGHPVIMGRRTFESIGRPLPGRHNIVISRTPGFRAPGCTVAASPESAIEAAAPADDAMVIGGARVYEAFLPRADRILLTVVEADLEGDTFFPAIDFADWEEAAREDRPADAANPHALSFRDLRRL